MAVSAAAATAEPEREHTRGLFAAFALAYVVAAAALALLVHFGGIWNLLANSRLLDVLGRGGVIAITDTDQGIVQGIPDPELYLLATQPVDWELLLIAAGLFLLMWGLKAAEFHGLCRFVGLEGSMGQHARAWFYGHGVNRLVPYEAGQVAKAEVLEGQGGDPVRAAQAVHLSSLMMALQIGLLALYGLFAVGFGTWFAQLFWAFVILGVAYLMVRPDRKDARSARRESLRASWGALQVLAQRPLTFLRLLLFGTLSILLVDAAAYAISQAFSNTTVIMNVEGDNMLMAVIAGYIARLVQFTPGGLGQWEWGFAAALYVGGLGFPEAATIALLVTLFRYLVGGLVFAAVTLGYGVETSLRQVLARFNAPATSGASS
jgi:Lysylphosphatidylglycerol synthase TM region